MEDNDIRKKSIDRVSINTGFRRSDVKKVLDTSFEFVAYNMAKGNFDAIRLPYFGIFKAKEYRIFAVNNPQQAEINNRYRKQKLTNDANQKQNKIDESRDGKTS